MLRKEAPCALTAKRSALGSCLPWRRTGSLPGSRALHTSPQRDEGTVRAPPADGAQGDWDQSRTYARDPQPPSRTCTDYKQGSGRVRMSPWTPGGMEAKEANPRRPHVPPQPDSLRPASNSDTAGVSTPLGKWGLKLKVTIDTESCIFLIGSNWPKSHPWICEGTQHWLRLLEFAFPPSDLTAGEAGPCMEQPALSPQLPFAALIMIIMTHCIYIIHFSEDTL